MTRPSRAATVCDSQLEVETPQRETQGLTSLNGAEDALPLRSTCCLLNSPIRGTDTQKSGSN